MKIYKTRQFSDWMKKEKVNNTNLLNTINEMQLGLKGSSLANSLYKKRLAIGGKGKRSGGRVIIAFISKDRSFFIYGFSKNENENITEKQKTTLKKVSKKLLSYDNTQLQIAIKNSLLFEVKYEKEKI